LFTLALPRLQELSGPGLSCLVRSASGASPVPRELMDAVADECVVRLGGDGARVEGRQQQRQEVDRGEASNKAKDKQGFYLGPRELPVVLSAFARAQHKLRAELLGLFAEASRRQLPELNSMGLASLAYAFASLGSGDEEATRGLVGALVEEANKRGLALLNDQSLANISWALTAVGEADPRLMGAIAKVAAPRLHR